MTPSEERAGGGIYPRAGGDLNYNSLKFSLKKSKN